MEVALIDGRFRILEFHRPAHSPGDVITSIEIAAFASVIRVLAKKTENNEESSSEREAR